MQTNTPKTYELNQYKVLDYFMIHVDLEIDLSSKPACSKAKLTIKPNPDIRDPSPHLRLDGELMMLKSLALNGRILTAKEYTLDDEILIIHNVPQGKEFYIETESSLSERTDLFGLYQTDAIYLVKAETEGLRWVFYCIDRPDNLATYTTKIIAHKKDYPVLLSNGVLIEKNDLGDDRHYALWSDSLPKPSYLFALVAGNLNYTKSLFKTRSGRDLAIEFYVSSKDISKCEFAQEVLKKAMKWDEEAFDLECDLQQHRIAGVDKYASGASEPTGLNLFNTENLFATPQIKTDAGMLRVLEVVAHEFFHYWSGNRVTIRDWFNLPFKEGLTTFRAALFCEDLLGTDLTRLINGKNLDERAPRQSSYVAVRSLYTIAAYEKCADIFRMMMLVIGKALFYKSMSHFLKEHDGKAVTIEEMLDSLTSTTSIDMNAFLPWFTEPGIPQVTITDHYEPEQQRYLLHVHVVTYSNKPIPLLMSLLDSLGNELIDERLLLINQPIMEFEFLNCASRPIPSLLRSFSASIYLKYEQSNDDLLTLMRYDGNLYNRCEAAKRLIVNLVTEYCTNKTLHFPTSFFAVYKALVHDHTIEPWILAELLTINSEEELIGAFECPPFELLADARQQIQKAIAYELKKDWPHLLKRIKEYKPNANPQFTLFDIKDAGMRRLKTVYYSYAHYLNVNAIKNELVTQFNNQLGTNMTETISALSLLGAIGCEQELDVALTQFYNYWYTDTHAINYWFRTQAALHSNSVLDRVSTLLDHPAFDILNPNKIYSLLGTFITNPYGFHNSSGKGYQLIAKVILILDQLNPPLAANLVQKFTQWERYDEHRRKLICSCLTIIENEASSADVKNGVKKIMIPI